MMEKRKNFSRKRLAILSALQGTKVHPTAEWVHSELRPQYPDLSLGTVYRNLKEFCQSGQAISVGVINGQEHFDACTDPHAHFVCSECGAVLDICAEMFGPQELARLSEASGMQVESASVTFRGVCPSCLKKEKVS